MNRICENVNIQGPSGYYIPNELINGLVYELGNKSKFIIALL